MTANAAPPVTAAAQIEAVRYLRACFQGHADGPLPDQLDGRPLAALAIGAMRAVAITGGAVTEDEITAAVGRSIDATLLELMGDDSEAEQ